MRDKRSIFCLQDSWHPFIPVKLDDLNQDELDAYSQYLYSKERVIHHLKSGLGNMSIKNRLKDRFSGSKCRQVTGQIFTGRISDRKAEQVFKTETGFWTGKKTVFLNRTGRPVLLENLSQGCKITSKFSPHLRKKVRWSGVISNHLTSPHKNWGDFKITSPHPRKIEVISKSPHLTSKKLRWFGNHLTSPRKNRGDFKITSPHLKKNEVISKSPHLTSPQNWKICKFVIVFRL